MRRATIPLLCGALAALAAACSRGGEGAGGDIISRQTYVRATVALQAIPDTAPGADSLRAAELRRLKVTAPQLREFVRRNGLNTERMAELWREVSDSLRRRDSISVAQAAMRADTIVPKPAPPPDAAGGVQPPAPGAPRPVPPSARTPAEARREAARERMRTLPRELRPDSARPPRR